MTLCLPANPTGKIRRNGSKLNTFKSTPNPRMRAASKALAAAIVVSLIFVTVAAYFYASPLTSAETSSTTTSASQDNGSVLYQTTTSSNDPNQTAVNVAIQNGLGYPDGSAFNPQVITVVIGVNNTVVWTNYDNFVHDVMAVSGPTTGPESGDLAPGAVYSFTFTIPGNYSYYCAYHPWMTGEVIVENA